MQMDWSKSSIRHPETRKRRELELKEWLEQDDKYIHDNNFPPMTPEQQKQRLEFFTAMLTENPIDLPLPTDDFEYTKDELKQCCLRFPVTVEIRGDLLNRFTIQYLDRNQPGVPYNQVDPRLFNKIEKILRFNWRRHQAKLDRFRTTNEYLKEMKMFRARFHRYVRRSWVEKQRESAAVVDVSEDESISDFGSFNNTVILSQPRTDTYSQPSPSQQISQDALSEPYSVFSQNLLEAQISTQQD